MFILLTPLRAGSPFTTLLYTSIKSHSFLEFDSGPTDRRFTNNASLLPDHSLFAFLCTFAKRIFALPLQHPRNIAALSNNPLHLSYTLYMLSSPLPRCNTASPQATRTPA